MAARKESGKWKQSANMVKTRSYVAGPDTVMEEEDRKGPTFGAGDPDDEPSYAARYKAQAGRAGAKYRRGDGKSTDQTKGYGQAHSLNQMGSNRF